MKYLGVDFGLKRIGLATSEGNLATPWKIIEGNNFSDLVEKIQLEAIKFDKVVIGLPQSGIRKKIERVINILRKKGLDILETDETLSTKEASRVMIELNIPKNKRVTTDAYAAAIILQNFLDSKA